MMVSASFLGNDDEISIIKKFNQSNVDYIHYDIMDGTMTNNTHLLPNEIYDYLDVATKKKDIHIMSKDPLKYLKPLSYYDISYLTIHYEINDFMKSFNTFKNYGFNMGIAIKPDTDIESIYKYLKDVSLVLILSVYPGASGQKFILEVKDKISKLKDYITKNNLDVKISVDGGINDEVIKYVDKVDILVSSSFILKDLDKNVLLLKNVK